MSGKLHDADSGATHSNAVLDAARYRRLAALVGFGMWSVTQHEVIDSMGCTQDTPMNDKADMDAWLDKPEVIQEADTCSRALKLMAANAKVTGAPTTNAITGENE